MTAIASRGSAIHALALKADGSVVAWGYNGYGQATVPAGLSNVIGIATGGFHSLALKGDGTGVAWGFSLNGQTKIPPSTPGGVAIADSQAASFLLTTGPHIYFTSPLQDQAVSAGAAATFSANAVGYGVGSGPLTYQWRKDGVAILGATASTSTLSIVTPADDGNYSVVVTNMGSASALATSPARLTVNSGRLINLSCL